MYRIINYDHGFIPYSRVTDPKRSQTCWCDKRNYQHDKLPI